MKIPAFEQFNISGLCSAKFTLAENILSISYPDKNHQVIVNLKSGQSWIDLYFTKSAEDSFIDPVKDESGDYYNARIKLVNPYLSPEKAATFKDYKEKDVVFLLEDGNGFTILIGTIEKPARMAFKLSIPAGGRNQRQIDIDAVSDQEPYYVIEEITIEAGSFNNSFNKSFSI